MNMNEHEIKKDEVESLARIFQEFKNGFDFLKKYPKTVSIFGSARTLSDDVHSKQAEVLAGRIAKELKYAVITGGGPGIMQSANKGAKDAGGLSVGITIKLPKEQDTNGYVTEEIQCNYFFTRKTLLTFAAEAYVAFPGGFGTFDELFDILTLIQNKKIPAVPVILIGADFWQPLYDYMLTHMLNVHQAIDPADLNLFTITDDLDTAMEIIKKAPVARWWRHIEA